MWDVEITLNGEGVLGIGVGSESGQVFALSWPSVCSRMRFRARTEDLLSPMSENYPMGPSGRFAVALVLCVGLASVALAGTIWRSQDNDGLVVGELLRLESAPESGSSALDDHFRYSFEILGDQRPWTESDMAQRFTPEFREAFPAEDLQNGFGQLFNDIGPLSFIRILEQQPDFGLALMAAENGVPFELQIALDAEGLIQTWGFDQTPSPPPLRAWESSLMLVGGWLMIAGAALAWRHEAPTAARMMLAASIVALAGVLVLSRSGLLYGLGRSVPGVLPVFGVLLLFGGQLKKHKAVAVVAGGAAAGAAIAGVVAPFVRDATLIGHPALAGAVADNETMYRLLLTVSAVLTAVALGIVAVVVLRGVERAGLQLRPPLWGIAVIALIWGLSAGGAAVDLALGDGLWANGPFRAASLSAVALLPGAAVFQLAAQRWSRPELAALVIDLESDGAELQPAIAKALGDPTLQVLTSPDGLSLHSDAGNVIDPDRLPAGRSLTRIQSGNELVGALVHTAALQEQPDRLQSVAAAAGMAMQVSRLNQKVVAQLAEVDASRARILGASDSARRRVERDLHDGAQQRLVALGIRLQKARRMATSEDADELAGQLDEASSEVREIIREIRDVARGAQPALLAERGLIPAVDALAERAPVPVSINITSADLSLDMERTAYFVIAEGLTNVAKHAGANGAGVSMVCQNGLARITIEDDGTGGAAMTPGSGLEGLKDRVAAAGGNFTVSSGPTGTTLEATLPCE